MTRLIKIKNLHNLLGSFSKDYELIAPKKLPNKELSYQAIENLEDIYLGEEFTVEPIKKFFLEPYSHILSHKQDNCISLVTPKPEERKRIIIGARSCETRGLELLDNIYNSSTHKDMFYLNNRNRTIVIGRPCEKPDKDCFCVSMGSSPTQSRGMDAMLFTVKDGFILEALTDKVKDIFVSKENSEKEQKPDKEHLKGLVKKEIKIPKKLDDIFEDDYWEKISRSCISCGICTYLCPTCHCFDLVEEDRKKMRCYDGCSFPDFTIEASGANPRPTKKERYRQRVFHKFNYFKKNFGEDLCVGCGRCIRFCPVKIDIADIVDKVPLSKQK